MPVLELVLPDETATAALGARLAPLLRRGDFVGLSGPLGAGKTTLARALVGALSGDANAPSPTFGLVALYDGPDFPLAHFDLYRIDAPSEVAELGFDDARADGVVLVEWPERIAAMIPEEALVIRLDPQGRGRRARLLGGGDWPLRLIRAGLAPPPESAKTPKA